MMQEAQNSRFSQATQFILVSATDSGAVVNSLHFPTPSQFNLGFGDVFFPVYCLVLHFFN